jgi:serine/threonine-protein kinase HipA
MTETLDTYLSEEMVGTLAADDQGRMSFTYVNADCPPISISLPPTATPYDDRACRPFFSGLLPEGAALERAATQKRLQVYETFKLLQSYGAECAGAIRLLPVGTSPNIPTNYELLEGETLDKAIADISEVPIFARDSRARLSVAGVQLKTAVRVHKGAIYKPLAGSLSTHIVKVASADYPDLPQNEAFCMKLAERLGLDVAKVELREAGGKKFILVDRYDRISGDESIRERHQEDFCQALGYVPARKYEMNDKGEKEGPGLEECFNLLNKTRAPALARQKFTKALAYNYLIANADAHAKNYSLVYGENVRAPELAPLYDLVCTRIYKGLTTDLAMRCGSTSDPEAVSKSDWEAVAKVAGIRFSYVHEMINEIATTILPKAQELRAELGYFNAENIIRVIGDRLRNLVAIFDMKIAVDVSPYIESAPGWKLPS